MGFMLSQQVRNWLVSILCFVLTICAVILTWNIRLSMQELRSALANTNRASLSAADYVEFQTDLIKSDPYQKSLKASIDTPAIWNGTGRLVNTQVIPRLMKNLDQLNGTLAGLTENTRSLNTLVRNTDAAVNNGLLPEATKLLAGLRLTADKLGATTDELTSAVALAAQRLGVSLDTLNALLASPEWIETIRNIDKTTAEFAITSTNIAAASKQFPSVAASLEKIAKTSSRFTKITLISNIIATLARAFLP